MSRSGAACDVTPLKLRILRLLRCSALQPLWELLHHAGLVGMNYWGGSSLRESGEEAALDYVSRKTVGQAPVVFDVGANTGQYALAADRVLGPSAALYSFEPSRVAFEVLARQTASLRRCRVFNFGLSDAAGTRELSAPAAGSPRASLYRQHLRNADSELFTETVELRTLDSFCALEGIERIDLLKIDVEGHEYEVLLGARRMLAERRVRFVQFEFGDRHIDARTYLRDFYDLLSQTHRLYRIVPDGLRRLPPYSPELEIFATINLLAEPR
jgi:FkbM family methyltransferase